VRSSQLFWIVRVFMLSTFLAAAASLLLPGTLPAAHYTAQIRISSNATNSPEVVTVLGAVYDPFMDELWTAIRGQPARLNGKKIQVGSHASLDECIISTGFANEGKNLKSNLELINQLMPKIRKIRVMGSAALALTYVASGRFDGYVERGLARAVDRAHPLLPRNGRLL